MKVFAKSPDADYEGSLLLEQYQAPVTAALTPAFSADSTPEILASAVQVCAAFVGSGIVKDVNRMGRILRLFILCCAACLSYPMDLLCLTQKTQATVIHSNTVQNEI